MTSSEHNEEAQPAIVVTVSGIMVLLQPAISVLVAFSIIALQLFLESYVLLFESTAKFVSFEQLEKTPLSISLTEFGMKTVLIPEQPMKAIQPMETTEIGIVTDDNPEQPAKAPLPIAVIELGIIVFLHPAINSLVELSIIALQLCLESYFLFLLSTAKFVNLEQPAKAQ